MTRRLLPCLPIYGIRARLFLLVLTALGPVLALLLYANVEQRAYQAQEAEANVLRLAHLASDDHERLLEGTRHLLLTLAQLPQVRGGEPAACSALLAELLPEYPLYANLFAVRPSGEVYCQAASGGGSFRPAERPYFQRVVETRALAVGEYQAAPGNRRPVLPIAYPVLGPGPDQRQLLGVVVATLDLSWLNRFGSELALPAGSTLVAVDRAGTVLARHPDAESWVGSSIAESELGRAVLTQHGGVVSLAGPDGVPRLYGFSQPHGDEDLHVAVGIPTAVAFAQAERTLTRSLGGLALIAVLTLVASRFGAEAFLLRPLRTLVSAAERLRAGDLGARSDLPPGQDELGILARAFDGMASALQRRAAERHEAEERIRREAARAAALADTAARLNAQLELERVLGVLCEETARALSLPAASVALLDEGRQELVIAAEHGLPGGYRELAEPIPRAVYDEYVRRAGQVIVLPDVQTIDGLPDAELSARLGIRTVAVAGIVRDGRLLGCLNAISLGQLRRYQPDELALLQGLADLAGQAIANARLFADAERRLSRLQALRTVDAAITASLDLRVTLAVFLDEVTRQLSVDAAAVLLLEPATQRLTFAAGRGFRRREAERTDLRLGEDYPGLAALERRTVHDPDLAEHARHCPRHRLLETEGFVAYWATPLLAKGQVRGVLEVFQRSPLSVGPVGDEWESFLAALAGQAAIAVDNAGLFDGLQRANSELALAYDATLEGWSRTLELRDRETEGHSQRVTAMTVALAREMGVPTADLVHVRRGALLHDIGKMGIPDAVLLKPGPLDEPEWAIMRRHPSLAYELLSPITFLRPALEIPYCHHERWDGSGYPRGLRGAEIPLAARIFAVVDVWDALRSDRPYRSAWGVAATRDHLREQAGRHFDPDVVAAFQRLPSD